MMTTPSPRPTTPPPRYVDAAVAVLLCGIHLLAAVTLVPYLGVMVAFVAGFGNYGRFDSTPYDVAALSMVVGTLVLAVLDVVVAMRRGRRGQRTWWVCLGILALNTALVLAVSGIALTVVPD